MKTKLIFLVMLIACISCGTNKKPVSDAQKEKIKGEVKEVVNTIIKNGEEANFDMAMGPWLNSPDFIYIVNGSILSYQDVVNGMGPMFDLLSSQKVTIVSEKFSFLDKSTVLYTTNCKFLENFKDGHSDLNDPTAWFILFRKIDNSWKAIYGVESYIEKNVNSESSKGLKQAELLMKFVGNFEAPLGKDTTQVVQFKRLQGGNILSLYTKGVTKGKVLFEGTGFWGYNAAMNKIDLSVILSGGHVFHYLGEFISPNKLELIDVNNATGNKFIFESISPDEFKETTIANNKTKTRIVKRLKK